MGERVPRGTSHWRFWGSFREIDMKGKFEGDWQCEGRSREFGLIHSFRLETFYINQQNDSWITDKDVVMFTENFEKCHQDYQTETVFELPPAHTIPNPLPFIFCHLDSYNLCHAHANIQSRDNFEMSKRKIQQIVKQNWFCCWNMKQTFYQTWSFLSAIDSGLLKSSQAQAQGHSKLKAKQVHNSNIPLNCRRKQKVSCLQQQLSTSTTATLNPIRNESSWNFIQLSSEILNKMWSFELLTKWLLNIEIITKLLKTREVRVV